MPVNLGIMKLCVCAGAGAMIGGAAVKVADKPRPRVHKVIPKRSAVARIVRPAPPPPPVALPALVAPQFCEPLIVQGEPLPEIANPELVVAPSYIPGYLPIVVERLVPGGGGGGGTVVVVPGQPGQVPEPAMLTLFGLGAGALLLRRRRAQPPNRA